MRQLCSRNSLKQTLEIINADVIALQEIKDRRALEYFFSSEDWNIIIDEQSTDDQNLAFVIRKGVDYRLASGNQYDADNEDFLFRQSNNFPDKRDVLAVYLQPDETGNNEILVLNHHAKSRYNGRVTHIPHL